MDSAQWLADYEQRLTGTAASAEAASAELSQVSGQARTPHGEVEVRVTATGALADLRLTPAARKLEADALAQLILATARDAQRAASARTLEIMDGYLGDGPALDAIRQYLPAQPAGAHTAPDDDYFGGGPEVIR